MAQSDVRGERTRRRGDRAPGGPVRGGRVRAEGGSGGPGLGDTMSLGTASGGGGPDGHGRGHGGRRGKGGRGRRKHRILRWSATVLAVLIVGTAGAGYLYYQHLNHNLDKDDLNL